MIVVVTGGCGFIGLNLVALIVGKPGPITELRLIDNLSNGTVEALDTVIESNGSVVEHAAKDEEIKTWIVSNGGSRLTIKLIIGDICDASAVDPCMENADAAVHLAGQTGVEISIKQPLIDIEQNVVGTGTVLEACRKNGVARFSVASSMAVIGDALPPHSELNEIKPLSPYAASKATIELYCRAYHRSYGINTLPLRFANVHGRYSWRKGSAVAAFMKRALSGQPITIDGDGLQTRDFVFASDIASVLLKSALGDTAHGTGDVQYGEPVNIATGVSTTVRDLVDRMRQSLLRHGIEAAVEHGPKRDSDVASSEPVIERLTTVFPDQKMNAIHDVIDETVDWFVANREHFNSL